MDSDKRSPDTETQSREQVIAEALTNKRRVLDEEITAFKAVKDQEFKAFESYLRKWPGESTVESAEAQVESMGLRYKIKKPKFSKESNEARKLRVQRGREALGLTGRTRVIGEAAASPEEEVTTIRMNARKRAEKANQHEREMEFQGVITPSYLPLLDGGSKTEGSKKENEMPVHSLGGVSLKGKEKEDDVVGTKDEKKTIKKALDKDQMKIEIANARRSTTPVLSSSAEYHPPALISPPANPSRPLSSSVPPEHQHDLDQRRSSGRSDLSIESLKSSLKDPSQPKSPKKVQFSIDNVVVSPSTSPLASWPSTKTGSSAPERYQIIKGKRDGKSNSNGTAVYHYVESSSSAPTLNSSLAGMSLSSYFHSKRDNANANANSTTSEDFDILDDEEDVFTFDEDISLEKAGKKKVETEAEIFEEDIEEEDVGGEPPLTGSSPHAGSLPIEIKMPSRRLREAEDG